ncbi:MAG: SufD family Fe-S cluster assembly protein, partial [Candidatus Nomurabacteria bacterium]|nr:SufD family Fe-S cluster assembly protein [Candidatus Nomurabacteria bacterium]
MKKVITRTVRGKLEQRFLVQASQNDTKNIELTVRHDKPNTTSKISILVVASGQSHVVLNATTTIHELASGTNARLEIHVITQNSAVVTAAPNLKIHNSAVKASHALTTKRISGEELFYL